MSKKMIGYLLSFVACSFLMGCNSPSNVIPSQKKISQTAGKHISPKRQQLADLEKKHGKRSIKWDSKTGRIKRLSGKGIAVNASKAKGVDAQAREFLNEYAELLQVDVKKIKVKRVHNGKKLQQVVYQQMHEGIPVADSFTTVTVKNGHVVLYKSNHKIVPDSVPTTPKVKEKEARKKVKNQFNLDDNSSVTTKGVKIYQSDNGNFNLVHEFITPVMEINGEQVEYVVHVDAIDGSIVSVVNELEFEDVSGTITGTVYPVFTHEPPIEVPFREEWVTVNENVGETDHTGSYLISDLVGPPFTVESMLEGPWTKVENAQLDEAHYSSTESTWNWANTDTSYKQEESNCFHHVNLIHDYLKRPELDIDDMDFQMHVWVNVDASCNASAGPNGINFFEASIDRKCESTGLDAGVIYHEYGHRINHVLVNSSWPYRCQSGNLNEGLADYWGCTVLDDPCHSRYKNQDPENPTSTCTGRRCNSTKRYPENYNCEPHSAAELVSGTFWDIREVLGADYTDKLVIDALRMSPMTFADMIENTLIADDDNADLSDGTPNIDLICDAAYEKHGIFSAPCEGHVTNAVAEITFPGYRDSETSQILQTDVLQVLGTAIGSPTEPFNSYKVEHSHFESPGTWSTTGVVLASNTKVVEGLLASVDASTLKVGRSDLRLTVNYGDNKEKEFPVISLLIISETKPGFPIDTGRSIHASATVLDLDGDSVKEIAIGSGSRFYVIEPDGTLHPNWTPPEWISVSDGRPAIFDVDGDMLPEIFVNGYRKIHAWNHDGSVLDGWPQDMPDRIDDSSITIGDLDNDGNYEILVVAVNGALEIRNADGSLQRTIQIPNMATLNTSSSPTIADVDGDGDLEIFCGNQNDAMYGWHHDGTLITGWPFIMTNTLDKQVTSEATVVNLDGAGNPEIIFYSPMLHKVYVVDDEANLMFGWPVNIPIAKSIPFGRERSGISVADVDNDGDLEIFMGHWDRAVHGFNIDGTALPGWPKLTTNTIAATPVLVDIDGDNDLEILVGNVLGTLYGWHHDGTPDSQFPIFAGGSLYGTLFVGDIDNNGKTDIVAGSRDSKIYAWELDSTFGPSDIDWHQAHANLTNTGEFNAEVAPPSNFPPVLERIGDQEVIELGQIEFTLSYSDVEDHNVSCSAVNLPPGSNFDTSTCIFSWTPSIGTSGTYLNITFVITDDGDPPRSDSEGINIEVLPHDTGQKVDATFVGGLYCTSGGIFDSDFFSTVTDYGENFYDTGGKLEFDIPVLPLNATILEATLSLKLQSVIGDCTLGDPLFFYRGTELACETAYNRSDDPGVPPGWLSTNNSNPQDCVTSAWKTFNIKETIQLSSNKLFLEIRANDLDGIESYRLWLKPVGSGSSSPKLSISYTLESPTGCTQDSDCTDHNICNGIEACVDGECQPRTPLDCDDGLFCNGVEICNPLVGCQAGGFINCNDNVNCTVDNCNETLNSCTHIPNHDICSDGLFCNGVETCNTTTDCQSGIVPNCNDDIDCTVDSCNETLKSCTNTPDSTLCSDGLFCNGAEICDLGQGCLSGTAPNCDDHIDCTTDSCDDTNGGGCKHVPNNNVCIDDLFCNGIEVCNKASGCQSGTNIDCNDNVDCTVDECNELSDGCMNTPDNSLCSNELFCDGEEVCHPTLNCQPGTGMDCDDGVSCTTDSCDESTQQCVHECVPTDPSDVEVLVRAQQIEQLAQDALATNKKPVIKEKLAQIETLSQEIIQLLEN